MSSVNAKRKKSMRVATVFTGVAACTVGMTQVANAQDIRPAQNMRLDGRIFGSISYNSNCAESYHHDYQWLHISTPWHYPSGAIITQSDCFGFKGTFQSPSGTGLFAECGGTNKGWLIGVNNGRSQSFHFGPGTTYHPLSWSHLYTVEINSWTGTDKCGVAPNWGKGSES